MDDDEVLAEVETDSIFNALASVVEIVDASVVVWMTISSGNLFDSDVFLFSVLTPVVIELSSSIVEDVVFSSIRVLVSGSDPEEFSSSDSDPEKFSSSDSSKDALLPVLDLYKSDKLDEDDDPR